MKEILLYLWMDECAETKAILIVFRHFYQELCKYSSFLAGLTNFTIFNISNKKCTYILYIHRRINYIYILNANDDCNLLAIVQWRISIERKYGATWKDTIILVVIWIFTRMLYFLNNFRLPRRLWSPGSFQSERFVFSRRFTLRI